MRYEEPADLAEPEKMIAPFAAAVARLDEIPGVGTTAARAIIAEVGLDMSRFPTLPTWPLYWAAPSRQPIYLAVLACVTASDSAARLAVASRTRSCRDRYS